MIRILKYYFSSVLFLFLLFFSVLSSAMNTYPYDDGNDLKYLPRLQFLPETQPENTELEQYRKKLSYEKFKPETFPTSICLIKKEKKDKRKGICYNVTMKSVLGLTKKELIELRIVGCEDWYDIFYILRDYCYQVVKPQKNSIAVYLKDNKITHFACAESENLFRSKFGTRRGIYEHTLWLVPGNYGKEVLFFNLKKKFQSDEGKKILFDQLKKISHNSKEMELDIISIHQTIAKAIVQNKSENLLSFIKKYPYAIINMTYQGRSLLEYAKRNNYTSILEICKQYKVKDNNDKQIPVIKQNNYPSDLALFFYSMFTTMSIITIIYLIT